MKQSSSFLSNYVNRWSLSAVASFVVHISAFFILTSIPHSVHRQKKRLTKVRLLKKKKPPPPPRKAEKRPPPKRRLEPKKKKKKKKKKRKKRKKKKRRRPPPPPPPPNRKPPKRPPPRDMPPPRPMFGLTASSLGKGKGGRTARFGNTLMKDPDKNYDPSKVKPYYGQVRRPPPPRRKVKRDIFQPIAVYEVDKNPIMLRIKAPSYPKKAKDQEIECKIVLSVEVRRTGRVRRVRVISIRPSSAKGYGFEKAIVRALRRARFKPARYKGKPVDVVIRHVHKFELDD